MSASSHKTRDRPRRPTLKTIAELSGLAMTTVSRALGDAPDISAETKRLVRRIADEVGYVPDRAGVRLRTGRTNVIALIVPMEEDALNMTSRLVAAIAGELSGTRYHLVVVPEMPGQTLMDPVRHVVETRSADAVIFNRVQPQDLRVAFLKERGFPFATHGRSDWQAEHAWFDYDNAAFGRRAVAQLAGRGRRHVLLLAPPKDETYGREMRAGVYARAAELGVRIETPDDLSSDSPRRAVEGTVRHAVSMHKDLDGMILASPNAALAAIHGLEGAGHVIGSSIDLLAKETFPILNLIDPRIIVEHEDVRKAGAFLARAAMNEIAEAGKSHLQHLDGSDLPPDPA